MARAWGYTEKRSPVSDDGRGLKQQDDRDQAARKAVRPLAMTGVD